MEPTKATLGNPIKFEVGKTYKTIGGWAAKVIWRHDGIPVRFFVVHKPTEQGEFGPVMHSFDGIAEPTFAIFEPPRFGQAHPADLTEEEIKE